MNVKRWRREDCAASSIRRQAWTREVRKLNAIVEAIDDLEDLRRAKALA